MEPIILYFATGIAIGAISELLLLRRSDRRNRLRKTVAGRRPANRLGSVAHSIRTPSIGRVTIARPLAKPKAPLDAVSSRTQSPATYSEPPQSSCPTCGLSAPDKLMAEHLLGSPLHRKEAPAPVAPSTPPSTTSTRKTSTLEEDSRESMRSLLQMLVPPRAFGRRHVQRTANPLEQLVQPLE
jgi:hypothetical protein